MATQREIPTPNVAPTSLDIRPAAPLLPGTEMFSNRLRKNLRHLGKWARRSGVTCYRLYDGDLPEYAVAIDLYEGWAHVQEYAAPASVSPERAAARLCDVMRVTPEILSIPPAQVVLKVRRRQRGPAQYERHADSARFHTVHEGGLAFLVNLTDYLDTGLFLDHRLTRGLIRGLAAGKGFLNLFAYTGSATVYAAAGGAAATTTVDMSGVYLDWARRNMGLNGFFAVAAHRFIQEDCLAWVESRPRDRFDLIFLDPPTFSNSKRMGERTFEVQRDHAALLRAVAHLLAPHGTLLFSNNFRQFRMDRAALREFDVQEITGATIPPDFQRNPRIHTCWKIQRKPG